MGCGSDGKREGGRYVVGGEQIVQNERWELKKRMKAEREGDILVGMNGDGMLRLRGPVEGRPGK